MVHLFIEKTISAAGSVQRMSNLLGRYGRGPGYQDGMVVNSEPAGARGWYEEAHPSQ
jgi:hypothetical protein